MCNIAHHADIGGITPGSMAGGTEIYQEGTRIPVIRLFRQAKLQNDILDLLLLNARVPRSGAATISRRSRPAGSACAHRRDDRAPRRADAHAAFDDIIRRTRDGCARR
jgi:N-methylhydantoinase B